MKLAQSFVVVLAVVVTAWLLIVFLDHLRPKPGSGKSVAADHLQIRNATFGPMTPCPKEADSAALDKLYPILGHMDSKSASSLDAAEKSIACLRPWAMGIADVCQRDSLLHWLEFYESRINAARTAWNDKGRGAESDLERYWRERREEERRTREYVSQHPFPKMPQCSDGGSAAQ